MTEQQFTDRGYITQGNALWQVLRPSKLNFTLTCYTIANIKNEYKGLVIIQEFSNGTKFYYITIINL